MAKSKGLTLGELRGLLSQTPSVEVWKRLWLGLKGLSVELLEETHLPYVQAHLEHWPSGLREVPLELKGYYYRAKLQQKGPSARRKALLPLFDHLDIYDAQDHDGSLLSILLQSPYLPFIQKLCVSPSQLEGSIFWAFCHSPALSQLRALRLRLPTISREIVEELAQSSWFAGLWDLSLSAPPAIVDGFRPWCLPELRRLSLSSECMAWCVQLLEQGGSGQHLDSLHLHVQPSDNAEMTQFLQYLRREDAPLQALHTEVHSYLSTADHVHALADVGGFPHLRSLQFGLNVHTRANVEAIRRLLVECELPALRSLKIIPCEIGSGLVDILREATQLSGLEVLEIPYTSLEDEDVSALAQIEHLSGLKRLDLRNATCHQRGLEALFLEPAFEGLEELCLRSTGLGNKRSELLGREHRLTRLKTLDIGRNQLTGARLLSILHNPCTPQLEQLLIHPNKAGIPTLFALLTTPARSQAYREHALEEVMDILDKPTLFAALKRAQIPCAQAAKKAEVIALLKGHLLEDEAHLLDFLCSHSCIERMGNASLKATLRTLGVKGYSKWSNSRLERTTYETVQREKEAIVAWRDRQL